MILFIFSCDYDLTMIHYLYMQYTALLSLPPPPRYGIARPVGCGVVVVGVVGGCGGGGGGGGWYKCLVLLLLLLLVLYTTSSTMSSSRIWGRYHRWGCGHVIRDIMLIMIA